MLFKVPRQPFRAETCFDLRPQHLSTAGRVESKGICGLRVQELEEEFRVVGRRRHQNRRRSVAGNALRRFHATRGRDVFSGDALALLVVRLRDLPDGAHVPRDAAGRHSEWHQDVVEHEPFERLARDLHDH